MYVQIRAVYGMLQHLETQFLKSLNSVGGSMWAYVVMNKSTASDNRPRPFDRIAGFRSKVSDCNLHCLLLTPSPSTVTVLALVDTEYCGHYLSCRELTLEFLFD